MTDESCVLCECARLEFFDKDKKREYWQCQQCRLVQVPSCFHLTAEQEKAEYDKHDNQNDDDGYRRFLSRCLTPVLDRVSPNHTGLDFGCGEGKVLSKMAGEAGIQVSNYDLFYVNFPQILQQQFDFVTATEVIEHIYDAKATFAQFEYSLKSDGILALMTKRVQDQPAFSRWHYKNDQTHICFYSIPTFEWIAQAFNWKLDVISNDVVIFSKGSPLS